MINKIKFNDTCIDLGSDSCSQLLRNKQILFDLNNKYYTHFSNFIYVLGNYERFNADIYSLYQLMNQENEVHVKMKTVLDNINIMQSKNTDKILIKSSETNSTLIETEYDIHTTQLFGTGNLTPSLLMEITYSKQSTIYNTILKIYPIDYFIKYEPYNSIFHDSDSKKQFNTYMHFYFYKEGLIGCWIKQYLLIPKITSTFACTYDSYITKGLPITQEKFTQDYNAYIVKHGKTLYKSWIHSLHIISGDDNWKKSSNSHFGYIEMEKIDFTLSQIINLKFFTIEMLFEIMYSKLIMLFIGNVYMADDHADNIMLKSTNTIRHYKIIRRQTEYNFYIYSDYVIKYIDFERFIGATNRNILVQQDDLFIRYYLSQYHFSVMNEYSAAMKMVKLIKDPLLGTVDNFCEIMHRCLPNYLKEPPTNTTKNIELYSINLDIPPDTNNFLNTFTAHIRDIDKPFIPSIIGGKYTNQNLKYKIKIQNETTNAILKN
jgi:hypothetical protein